MTRTLGGLFLLLLATPVAAQTATSADLTAALRLAQDGRMDSARATLRRMEQATVPTDSIFPGILYSEALVSPTAEEVKRQLQRVIVEYPVSSWAAPSMIALAQLDFANGDPAAAARTLEKFRTDQGASPLFPMAAMWGARASFDAGNQPAACQWVADGLQKGGGDAATRAELVTMSRRCGAAAAAATAGTPAAAPVATTTAPAMDSATRPPAPPVTGAPAPAVATAEPTVPAAWRIQVVAANSQDAADEMLAQAKKAGFAGIIVKEGGYFKVRLGSYASRADATAAAAKVKARLGGNPYVVGP